MNRSTIFMMVAIMALCFCLGTTMQSRAQDKSFSGIVPFVTSNDRVGFFDQSNGRIYMYDDNIAKCVFIGQLQSLGKPITAVLSNLGTQA